MVPLLKQTTSGRLQHRMVQDHKGVSMSRSMMEFILTAIEAEQQDNISLTEWIKIRRHGTPEELEEAVERMEAAGGYDNLQ